jgi:hypothetical protein
MKESIKCIEHKRIKVFQLSNDKIESTKVGEINDEFEDENPAK